MSKAAKIIILLLLLALAAWAFYTFQKKAKNKSVLHTAPRAEVVKFQTWVNTTKQGKLRVDGIVDSATEQAFNQYFKEYT